MHWGETDKVAVAISKHIGDAAEPGLHALLGGVFPVPRRDRLAHDAAGD